MHGTVQYPAIHTYIHTYIHDVFQDYWENFMVEDDDAFFILYYYPSRRILGLLNLVIWWFFYALIALIRDTERRSRRSARRFCANAVQASCLMALRLSSRLGGITIPNGHIQQYQFCLLTTFDHVNSFIIKWPTSNSFSKTKTTKNFH